MKIALIGYGKMGQQVEHVARKRNHKIGPKIDPFHPDATHPFINEKTLEDVDVCIDFTQPESVLENVKTLAKYKKNIVIGTTGWYDQIDEVKKYAEENQVGLIYAPNFSLGVNLFLQMVEHAAQLTAAFDTYDVGGMEIHHTEKKDTPSGTALSITNALLKYMKKKKRVVFEPVKKPLQKDVLHFSSLRLGCIEGMHEVIFDSQDDCISLKHTAKNRAGFAHGAILAAEWLAGKKGVYEIQDLMCDFIQKRL